MTVTKLKCFYIVLIRVITVEVCDARDDASSNSDGFINLYICNCPLWNFCYKPGYRFLFTQKEESPDSTEQCTGEEPGSNLLETDSATENNYSARRKGENVG